MAYTSSTLSCISDAPLGGQFKKWVYTSTDAVATFIGAGYIADATKRGMFKGDEVLIVDQSTPALYQCVVSSVSAGAATLLVVGPQNASVNARAYKSSIIIPVQLSAIVNSADYRIAIPFAFRLDSVLFRTVTVASTASKLATLTADVNAAAVTGGVMALTTANQNTAGGTVAGTAVTAGNVGTAGQTVGATASSVTAFAEGSGFIEFTVTNLDLLNATL